MQIIGLKGKSAYQYAQDGGYAGTEAEFKNKMAKELDTVYDYEDLNEAILATAIKPEVSGEFIHLTDSAALPIMNFGMEGKTEQFTTSGKQLWEHGDVTFVQKGTFDVHLEAGKYTFTAEVTSTDTDADTCLVHVGNNIARGYMQRGNRFSFTFELTETVDIIILYASDAMGNGENDTATFSNIMLNSDSTAKPYEPYTGAQPSPNPDYPQEIINAGTYNEATGRYEIGCKVINKNWFDKNWLKDYTTYDVQEGSYWRKYFYLEPNTTYRCVVKKPFHVDSSIYLSFLAPATIDFDKPSANGITTILDGTAMDKQVKFTTPEDGKMIIKTNGNGLRIFTATFEEIIDDEATQIMIYKLEGAVDDTYVPYASQPFTLTSPVPITKWDKLVKRDGVYGWSILSKECAITGFESFSGAGDSYYAGSSTNMFHAQTSMTSLAGISIDRRYIYCNELSFVPSVWAKTDGTVGLNTNGNTQIHMRLPNTLLGVSDDATVAEKQTAYRNYLRQRYDAGNPLKLLYKVDTEQSFHPLPDNEQALLKSVETYYQVTNIFNDQNCPMSIQYIADTQTYVDNLANSLTNAVVSLGGEV